ncbi:Endonuclease III [hydrothermal vent metagenome]|uniref:Endonuclease III n=1 Tax=hydrothermal vent metagenome TaxID=652676 RepID=A0A1W1BCD8_9ZZZZ
MSVWEIYNYLKSFDLLRDAPKYWWPNAGSFEVVISAILTQNTTWKNVEKSLHNLQTHQSLESFLELSQEELKRAIRPSGFYNQKASRLLTLAHMIKKEFGTFEAFQKRVERSWLLEQKGIGKESADAILCYACLRPTMVIDAYTKRVLATFDIEFKKYQEYKEFIEDGVKQEYKAFAKECNDDFTLLYARFHGMFVEYVKNRDRDL